jgi:SPX domain protein involved in polyphosphate accumulation
METTHRAEYRYWINLLYADELTRRIKEHLPPYSFSGGSAPSQVSTVFLDSSDFTSYRGRLMDPYHANIIRIRWYGSLNDGSMFIERKRRKGPFEKLKERFSIGAADIQGFLDGSVACEDATRDDIADDPTASELCADIRSLIRESNLYPRLRVVYKRQAFQLANDDTVRLTLDTQIEMKSAEGFPSIPLTGVASRFPFAILEVKLRDTNPDWIGALLTHQDIIKSYPDFSKFVHGMAVVFHTEQLGLPAPPWPLFRG